MALAVDPVHLLGLAAGVAVIGLGTFVVLAQPRATASRAFFVLALADGASSILFELRDMATTIDEKAYFMGVYQYFFIVFVSLLAGFGLLVPRPFRSRIARRILASILVVAAGATIIYYVLDHSAFWYVDPAGGATPIRTGPAGFATIAAFILVSGVVCGRLAFTVIRAEGTIRRQAAFILGGMALGYGSPAMGTLIAVLPGGLLPFDPFRPGVSWLVASFAIMSGILVGCALVIARFHRRLDKDVRRFLVASAIGVLLMVGLTNVPGSGPAVVQILALLAYPILLGYAIVRFAVFDIDAKLRRAATLTIATAGISTAFFATENVLANLVQDRLFGNVFASTLVASLVAAVLAAAVVVPIVRLARKAASRVVPALSYDQLTARKREIYRHSLAGALVDGLDEQESATLARLREALGISADEHASLMQDLKRSAAA